MVHSSTRRQRLKSTTTFHRLPRALLSEALWRLGGPGIWRLLHCRWTCRILCRINHRHALVAPANLQRSGHLPSAGIPKWEKKGARERQRETEIDREQTPNKVHYWAGAPNTFPTVSLQSASFHLIYVSVYWSGVFLFVLGLCSLNYWTILHCPALTWF